MSAAAPIQRDVAFTPTPVSAEVAGAPGAAMTQLADQAGDAVVNYQQAQFRASQEHLSVQQNVSATTQLNDLEDKYRTDPDPDTAVQRFRDDAAKVGTQLSGSLSGRYADQFSDRFGLMTAAKSQNLADIAFRRKQQDGVADLDNLIESSSRTAAFGNDAERAIALGNVQTSVSGLVSSGLMPAKEGQKALQTYQERLALFDGKSAIQINPGVAMKKLVDPSYLPQLDPLARVELQHSAEAEVRTRQREAREAQMQARMNAELAAQDLHEAASSGLPVAQSVIDTAVATARASGDPRAVQKVTGLLQAVGFASSMRGAAPREVDAGIAALADKANKEGATSGLSAAYDAALKFKEKMNTGLAHDPLGWAHDQGVINLSPLALNGTDSPQAFAQRVQQAQDVSRRYGVPFQPFTQAESQTLKTRLETTDPAQRLATLKMVVNGLGSNALPVLGKIGAADPALANAGALVASGPAYEGTARDILTGKHLLSDKANEALRPGPAALSVARVPQLMGAYAFLPDSRTSVLDGANALYATRAARQGLTGADVATSKGQALYTQALQEASGARFEADGTQWGGLGTYRRNPVIIPGNIKHDDFEDIASQFKASDLAKASVNGQPPHWEGSAASDDLMGKTWMVSAGNGVYGLSATNPAKGAVSFVRDGSGQPFRFRYGTALVSMQSRRKGAR